MATQDRPAFPAAPLDADGIAAALRPFGTSRMLPPAAYTSAEVFAWERQHFFAGGQRAGHRLPLPLLGVQPVR
jgi:glycine betaine catabolism A